MTKSVLIVEDNALNRRLFRELVCIAGHDARAVGSGAEALAAVAEARPDLILLDIMMPGLSGFQVLRALRADPGLAGIPVIAVTSLATQAEERQIRAAGFDGYMAKPVYGAAFAEALATWLQPVAPDCG